MLGLNRAVATCWPLVAASLAGCLPLIAHRPDVERGTHLTLAGALAAGQVGNTEDSLRRRTLLLPVAAVRGAIGMRSSRDADGAGAEVAAELIFPQGVLADAYVQAPRRWTRDTDVGVGIAAVLMAYKGPMVYAQLGRRISEGYYVFTTQGLARLTHSVDALSHDRPAVVWWQPTIAVEPIGSSQQIRYYFLTGNFGPTFNRCVNSGFIPCSTGAKIALGAAISPPLLPGRRR